MNLNNSGKMRRFLLTITDWHVRKTGHFFSCADFDQIDLVDATFGDQMDSLAANHLSVHGLALRGPISLLRANAFLWLKVPSLPKRIAREV
jgi:hypothetical protein